MSTLKHGSSIDPWLFKVTLALTVSLSGLGGTTLALAEETQEEPEEIVEEILPEEEAEEVKEAEPEEEEILVEGSIAPEGTIITEFAEKEGREIHLTEKIAVDAILAQLPSVMTVRVAADESAEGEWAELPVDWKGAEEYAAADKKVYDFVPTFEGYLLSMNAEVPVAKVIIGDGAVEDEGGFQMADLNFAIKSSDLNDNLKGSLPATYNNIDKMPPVRNQGNEGACWAFSSIGSVEADLIHDGKASKDSVDYSELQLAYFTTHDFQDPKGNYKGDSTTWNVSSSYLSNGGNYFISSLAFMDKIGVVNEADAPYEAGPSFVPGNHLAVSSDKAQIKGAYMYEIGDLKNIDSVKQAIIDHNGISVSIYADKAYYDATHNSYLCNEEKTNHAVMLVGWDDNFPATSFYPFKADRNGAWLVRNSWGGQGYDYSGYFWISYIDYSLGQSPAFAFDADTDMYDNVYGYQKVIFATGQVNSESTTATVTQSYNVDAGESVAAVGFLTFDADLDVTATVTDGTEKVNGRVSTTNAGFYTINLDSSLPVKTKKEITVTLTMNSKKGENVTVLLEKVGSGKYMKMDWKTAKSGDGTKINGTKFENDAPINLYTNSGTKPSGDKVDMFRMYNPNSGEHFYTGNEKEKDMLVNTGWKAEGVGFKAPKKSNTPMYRLYNANAGDHHYTSSKEERDHLINIGWKDEGIGWYADDAQGVAMYRLYNPNCIGAGSHHYTSNAQEKAHLIGIGWKDEGIGFYACK